VAQAHSLVGNDGVLGPAPIRFNMHVAVCINQKIGGAIRPAMPTKFKN
jgi:hypothetical protein